MRRTLVATGIIGTVFLAMTVAAQEKKLTRKDLPPAVEKTVAEQSKGASITGFSTEVEDGKKIYEAALVVDGHGRDISMDKDGRILEIEDEVVLASLPPAVQDGLKAAAGKGTLGKVEALTKNGKLVAYESVVTLAGKHHEVQVGPDGKKLAHPE
jgi:uncharacterized membrane protein YkoI